MSIRVVSHTCTLVTRWNVFENSCLIYCTKLIQYLVIIIQHGIEVDMADLKTINQSSPQIIDDCKNTYQRRLVSASNDVSNIFEEMTNCVKKGITLKQSFDKMADNRSCGVASLCLHAKKDSNNANRHYLLYIMNACWAIAYCMYIVGNQVQKKYCSVPFAALVMNIVWEFVFSFMWTQNMNRQQIYAHYVWFWLDAVLVAQFLWFEWKSIQKYRLWHILLTVTLTVFLVCFIVELNDYGGIYTGYVQNLVMSILFTREVLVVGGPSLKTRDPWTTWIAGLFRLIGTAAVSVYMSDAIQSRDSETSLLLYFLYYGVFIWDAVYVVVALKLWIQNAGNNTNSLRQIKKD